MKHFSYILFGGLALLFATMVLAHDGPRAWRFAAPAVAKVVSSGVSQSSSAFFAIASTTQGVLHSLFTKRNVSSESPVNGDGTTISGFHRIVRYAADDEEDTINATVLSLPEGADGRVSATAYLVQDLDFKQSVAEHNADKILPIASLTKLVTAVVARKLISQAEHITLTPAILSTYGNTAQFKAGETFQAEDLMYPLLMVSSNDAAEALAQAYGRAAFLKAMNDFASRIGAYHTYFADPSGLSPQNVSSARDLALILDWIRNNDPEIISITELKIKTIRRHVWTNPTHFLSWSSYLGGKNGYTDEANRTAASLFVLGPHKHAHAVIVLGSSTRDTDVTRLLGKVK